MIIIQFWAGLGNQMFQYAFYKKMCKVYDRNQVKAYFELDEKFERELLPAKGNDRELEPLIGFDLERVFGLKLPMAPIGHVMRTSQFYPRAGKHYWLYSRLYTLRKRIFGDKSSYIQPDDYSEYYPEIFELSPLYSYYLKGVWQNEKYFSDIREELIQDFTIKVDDEKNKNLLQEISSVNSVSIHLRSYQTTNSFHTTGKVPATLNTLKKDYYEKAIQLINSRVDNPKFYVFSDSVEAAKQMFNGMIEYTLVDHNRGYDGYKDLALMSRCKHNINGTGTFAFWGAYLNQNPGKIVITPKTPTDKIVRNNFSCEGWINI